MAKQNYVSRYGSPVAKTVRSRLIAGLLYLTPFAITFAVFTWVYNFVADSVRPAFTELPAFVLPLFVIAVLVLLPVLVGFLLLLPIAGRSLTAFGSFAKLLPVIGSIFRVGEGIATAVDPESHRGLNRVVRIQYPKEGIWSLGFLTSEIDLDDGERWAVVFLPTAPLPNSGWVALVRMEEVYEVDISAGEAMSITLSAGMLTPEKIQSRPLVSAGADYKSSAQAAGADQKTRAKSRVKTAS